MRGHLLDLFSGCGRVANAARAREYLATEVDILLGDHCDMSLRKVTRALCRLIELKRFSCAMLAPPCTSFSRARRGKPGGKMPGPLRTSESPWGLDNLLEKDVIRLHMANLIMKNTITVIRALLKARVPFIVENPQSSIMWWLPEVQTMLEHSDVVTIDTHFCQWGTRWKKATKFMCFLLGASANVLGKRCYARGCVCSRTGRPHVLLTGTSKSGAFWSQIAQPYPPALAKSLATVLCCNT